MSLTNTIYRLRRQLEEFKRADEAAAERLLVQFSFAHGFMKALDRDGEWEPVLTKAAEYVIRKLTQGVIPQPEEAEEILAPIGTEAKKYTLHCIGHAHIDMNWMWSWPETINDAHDTFYTACKLMERYPEAHFSQSQTALYKAMEEHFPSMADKIRKYIKSGNWECTAAAWVENDTNMCSGESLCRHLLYSRKYLREHYGLEPEDEAIQWSPDVFGQSANMPSILTRGGVTRYYHSRPYDGPSIYRWCSKDGSELLTFRDPWCGEISPKIYDVFLDCLKDDRKYGIRDFLVVYGWGDHGGGPTAALIEKLLAYRSWPILPVTDFSTVKEYFDSVENNTDIAGLPVIEEERNFVFEGCYSSQTNIKYANRISEKELPEAETLALLASSLAGEEYNSRAFEGAWQKALFSQFHDILTGSGVRATYNYAQGNFQDILAVTSSAKNRCLRSITEQINTASLSGPGLPGDSLGGGAADRSNSCAIHPNTLVTDTFGVTSLGLSDSNITPIMVYNPTPRPRTELVYFKLWNKKCDRNSVYAYDSRGNKAKCQVLDGNSSWGHDWNAFVFEAKDLPALGWKVFGVADGMTDPEPDDLQAESDTGTRGLTVEDAKPMCGCYEIRNSFLEIKLRAASGALVSVKDRKTGFEYIPEGSSAGLLFYETEAPNGMSSWNRSPLKSAVPLCNGNSRIIHNGCNLFVHRTEFIVENSRVSLDTCIRKNSTRAEFVVRTEWKETGSPEKGIPGLRVYFPTSLKNGTMNYEIPFGSMERPQSAQELPVLRWMSLSDKDNTALLLTGTGCGCRCNDGTLSMSLLRASYNPDPMPEAGAHEFRYAIEFGSAPFRVSSAMKAADEYIQQPECVSAPVQEGRLPLQAEALKLETQNAELSCLKPAENGKGIILRLYETEGINITARITAPDLFRGCTARETDTLERPLAENTAVLVNGILTVELKAHGSTTVLIEKEGE